MTEKQLVTEAKNKLRAAGFHYWFPPRTWGERDVFGIYDFIGLKKGQLIFVQITSLSHLSHRRKKIQDFFDIIGGYVPNSFVWAYDKKKGKFKVERVFKAVVKVPTAPVVGVSPTSVVSTPDTDPPL